MMDNEQILMQIAALIEQSEERTAKRFDSLEAKVKGLEVTLENETNTKINLMYESHQSNVEKLEKVRQIDTIKDHLSDIERAIIVHTAQIADLKKAH